jgi:hypothetical protein
MTTTLFNSQENSLDIHPDYWWAPHQVMVTLQRQTTSFNNTNSPLKLKTQSLHNFSKMKITKQSEIVFFSLTLYLTIF